MTLAAGTYTVNAASGLNLRADASAAARVLQGMPFGTQVTVTGNSRNGFAEVTAPAPGWAAEQYLSPVAVQAGKIVAPGSYRVTGDGVAIRERPEISVPSFGAGSNVVTLTALGAVVTASGQNQNGFAGVVDGAGHNGWMAARYLAPADPATAAVAAAATAATDVLHGDVNVGVPLGGGAQLTPTTPPAITPPPATTPGPLAEAPAEAPGVLGTTSPIIGLVLLAIALYFVAK